MFGSNFTTINSNIYAYLIINLDAFEIIDGNKLANEFYLDFEGYSPFENIFLPMIDASDYEQILKQIDDDGCTTINNITSTTKKGKVFICSIELSKISDTVLFVVIKENDDGNIIEVEHLLELFDNPIFAVKQDEKFSMVYGNQRCFQFINFNSQNSTSKFLSMFEKDKQLIIQQTINQEIDLYGECDVDVEVVIDNSITKLFRLKAYKSTYDGFLYGVLIGAKKQKDLLKKIEFDQQFFEIMQQFSKDLLFRIDVEKHTLIHRGDISQYIGLKNEMTDYPECMRDNRLIHPDDLEGYIVFAYRIMDGATATFDVRFQFNDGRYEKYRLLAVPIFDNFSRVVQVVGKSENIQKYEELKIKANYDILTSALNSHSFKELVQENISRSVVTDKFALLFIDIDDFSKVNDLEGHVYGDFILETTSKRIAKCIRSNDRIGRVGEDEFAVFFQYAPSREIVLERADAILQSIRRKFTCGEVHCNITASIGVALFPKHGNNYDELYSKAFASLDTSKELGKDIATIFE